MSSGSTALKSVTIESDLDKPDSVDAVQAVERFLQRCPSLMSLYLGREGHMLTSMACIARPGPALTALSLWPNHDRHIASARTRPTADMPLIANACQRLVHLAIEVPLAKLRPVEHLGDGWELGQRRFDVAHVPSEFETLWYVCSSCAYHI